MRAHSLASSLLQRVYLRENGMTGIEIYGWVKTYIRKSGVLMKAMIT
jgi:hypothetical protein